jgi:hypothetical protein
MLLDIGRRLAAAGHQVRVLAAQPSYHDGLDRARPRREVVDGVEILRLRVPTENRRRPWRRVVSTAAFLARVGLHLLWRRYDLVVCSTIPPVAQGWVVRAALRLTGRRGRYIYHCLDVYPEVAAAADMTREGWLYRWLQRVDAKTCAEAAAVVTLSRDMAATLRARDRTPRDLHLVNNFSLVPPLVGRTVHFHPYLPLEASSEVNASSRAGGVRPKARRPSVVPVLRCCCRRVLLPAVLLPAVAV